MPHNTVIIEKKNMEYVMVLVFFMSIFFLFSFAFNIAFSTIEIPRTYNNEL